MAKIIWKGGALLAPIPAVLVTCRGIDRDGVEAENVFTVAWTGILNTVPPKTYISVRKSRYSYDIIKNSGEFVINVPASRMVREVDYCGIYTGAKVDKFDKCGFTLEAASEVAAPCIGECPLSLECRVTDIVEMGTHDMFVADILCTDVNEDIIDAEGKLRLDKAQLMAFAHGEYFALGKKIGGFGFSAKKKSKNKDAKKVHSDKETADIKENKIKKKDSVKKDNGGFAFEVRIGDEKITDMKELIELVENSDDDVFDTEAGFEGDIFGDDHEKKKLGSSYGKKDRGHGERSDERGGKKYNHDDSVKKSAYHKKSGKGGFDKKEKDHGRDDFGHGKDKERRSFDKGRSYHDGHKERNDNDGKARHGKDKDFGRKGYKGSGDKKYGGKKK